MRFLFGLLTCAVPLLALAAPDLGGSVKVGGVSWMLVATAFVIGVVAAVSMTKPKPAGMALGTVALVLLWFSGLGIVGQLIFVALLFGLNQLNARRARAKSSDAGE